ncbi:MAG: hypothetical protein M3M96_05535 [Candidatus Eremiobacteraeota bacterium]|nr:hypothetical protein [Candidatus Eremiobacteraeota bacterium]
MNRQAISRVCGTAPIVLSLMAFSLVLFAVRTGWGQGGTDEGAGAHIFQLLILLEVPFGLGFLATADWEHAALPARLLAFQVAAVVLAFAPVAYFRL